jgi:hypothetical protein
MDRRAAGGGGSGAAGGVALRFRGGTFRPSRVSRPGSPLGLRPWVSSIIHDSRVFLEGWGTTDLDLSVPPYRSLIPPLQRTQGWGTLR